ncbi:MAG TPA: CsgG/HfaB family protein [Syntrophales bacterium]|nr:CsgG/HfaB family protein [Syntrophales bacterium]
MKEKKVFDRFIGIVILLLCLSLAGCADFKKVVSKVGSSFSGWGGKSSRASGESAVNADINIAKSPNVSTDELLCMKRISVFFEGGKKDEEREEVNKLLGDYVGLNLMRLGYDIVERQKLRDIVEEQALQQSGAVSDKNLIEAGKLLGIEAIISGTFIPSQKLNTGMLQGGSATVTVKQLSARIISIREGRSLVMIALAYHGSGAELKEASSQLANLINGQMKGDVKRKLTVNLQPAEGTIRILNIRPRYVPGMELSPGSYLVEASCEGYETRKQWVTIFGDEDVTVSLELRPRK